VAAHDFFLDLALILISARFLGELATRVGAPSVIGELLAGVVLGPSLFGVIAINEPLRMAAELGVILLLFEVGLDTDMSRLAGAGRRALGVALLGFVAPFALGYLVCSYFFGLDLLTSLFVGGTLTATSIGVTVRILRDLGRFNSDEGQTVLGAAVVDDILGVLLLALLFEFSQTGEVALGNLARLVAFIGLFFILAPVFATFMSRIVYRLSQSTEIPGLITTSIVSLVLGFGALAHLIGAPELLGGFAAGLALSRRFFLPFGIALSRTPEFSSRVDTEMRPIVNLFSPVFFVVVGVSLDLQGIDWTSVFFWTFSLSLLAVAILGKIAGGAVARGTPWPFRVAIGMAMVPRGEVGLVFAEIGRSAGIFTLEVYTALVIVVAYTTLLSPFWIKLFYRFYGHRMPPADEAPPTSARPA
jgi:Kef-type K+ transport system membrane component KefB